MIPTASDPVTACLEQEAAKGVRSLYWRVRVRRAAGQQGTLKAPNAGARAAKAGPPRAARVGPLLFAHQDWLPEPASGFSSPAARKRYTPLPSAARLVAPGLAVLPGAGCRISCPRFLRSRSLVPRTLGHPAPPGRPHAWGASRSSAAEPVTRRCLST